MTLLRGKGSSLTDRLKHVFCDKIAKEVLNNDLNSKQEENVEQNPKRFLDPPSNPVQTEAEPILTPMTKKESKESTIMASLR